MPKKMDEKEEIVEKTKIFLENCCIFLEKRLYYVQEFLQAFGLRSIEKTETQEKIGGTALPGKNPRKETVWQENRENVSSNIFCD